MDSRLRSRFSYTYWKISRPRKGNKLPKIPLPAWNLLLRQRHVYLENQWDQISTTSNQQGSFELREDVRASAGAQDMDTSGYELSVLEKIEIFWENPEVDLDAVLRPSIGTPVSPTAFNDLEMGKEDHLKTPFCWMRRKTRRTLLQQLQCLSVGLNLPGCSQNELLGDGLTVCQNMFVGLCFKIFKVFKMFH